jgi:hypothetical protein
VAAWSGFLLFIGAGAFAVCMAIHNEALASHRVPQARESSIYYWPPAMARMIILVKLMSTPLI